MKAPKITTGKPALSGLFCYFLLTLLPAQGQDSLTIQIPEAWLGHWQGQMTIDNGRGPVMQVFVALHIEASTANTWQWQIRYGQGDSAQVRNYALKARNAHKGQYLIDELNSIVLPAFFTQQTLISFFEVQGNLIQTIYRLEGESLFFENAVAKMALSALTGGKESEDIPPVRTYPVVSLQRARLEKK
ncbi:MAG: hypothetical protein HC913_03285 [Microscillaceae bacterium]|nr:hypothetical protein [Microscillaceae bacterium]